MTTLVRQDPIVRSQSQGLFTSAVIVPPANPAPTNSMPSATATQGSGTGEPAQVCALNLHYHYFQVICPFPLCHYTLSYYYISFPLPSVAVLSFPIVFLKPRNPISNISKHHPQSQSYLFSSLSSWPLGSLPNLSTRGIYQEVIELQKPR